jgi:hypothetical protein
VTPNNIGGVRERRVVTRRGRGNKVCARSAWRISRHDLRECGDLLVMRNPLRRSSNAADAAILGEPGRNNVPPLGPAPIQKRPVFEFVLTAQVVFAPELWWFRGPNLVAASASNRASCVSFCASQDLLDKKVCSTVYLASPLDPASSGLPQCPETSHLGGTPAGGLPILAPRPQRFTCLYWKSPNSFGAAGAMGAPAPQRQRPLTWPAR